jgi:hypothetical protein
MGDPTFTLDRMPRDEFMALHDECNRLFCPCFSLAKRFLRMRVRTRGMEGAIWVYDPNKDYGNDVFHERHSPPFSRTARKDVIPKEICLTQSMRTRPRHCTLDTGSLCRG